jgi:hypothetical protein
MNKLQEAIVGWMDKTLITEWRKAARMLSVQWGVICAAAAPIWYALTDEQKASILSLMGISPAWYVAAAALVGIYLRLKSQPKLHDEEAKDAEHQEP